MPRRAIRNGIRRRRGKIGRDTGWGSKPPHWSSTILNYFRLSTRDTGTWKRDGTASGGLSSPSCLWPTPCARMNMAKKSSASYRRGKLRRMRSNSIFLNEKARRELRRLAERPIDLTDADAPEVGKWMVAERGRFYRPLKEQITLRLDKDIIAWFKASGRRYQTRMNDALRDYVRRHLQTRTR